MSCTLYALLPCKDDLCFLLTHKRIKRQTEDGWQDRHYADIGHGKSHVVYSLQIVKGLWHECSWKITFGRLLKCIQCHYSPIYDEWQTHWAMVFPCHENGLVKMFSMTFQINLCVSFKSASLFTRISSRVPRRDLRVTKCNLAKKSLRSILVNWSRHRCIKRILLYYKSSLSHLNLKPPL